jgi:hypothetical protein
VSALATDTEVPKGYVDPVSAMGTDSLWELWERLEEIYLVPYEANVALFDSFLQRAENKRFHPVSGAPLILKRGEVIPEYKLDISYGPNSIYLGRFNSHSRGIRRICDENIQFGTTTAKAVLHNVAALILKPTTLPAPSARRAMICLNLFIMEITTACRKHLMPPAS